MSKIVKDQNLSSGKVANLESSDATISTLRLPRAPTGPLAATASGYFYVNVSGVQRRVAFIN